MHSILFIRSKALNEVLNCYITTHLIFECLLDWMTRKLKPEKSRKQYFLRFLWRHLIGKVVLENALIQRFVMRH